ncbi:MAG: hypothetical protein Q8Q31_01250 [Nanoarchaeota archaeon]|nr:hypothetical protein [Nanoarchaeota archaeon]
MTKTQQTIQIEGIDELLDVEFEESSASSKVSLSEEIECIDDLFYEKIASSALAFGKA